MDTDLELKALRYLINDLILQVYDLRIKLEEIKPSNFKYKMIEPNANGNSVGFDLFSIDKNKYNQLIDQYGIDIVNRAVVKLDEFIKVNEYIPFKTPFNSLKRRFIKEVLYDNEQKKKEVI